MSYARWMIILILSVSLLSIDLYFLFKFNLFEAIISITLLALLFPHLWKIVFNKILKIININEHVSFLNGDDFIAIKNQIEVLEKLEFIYLPLEEINVLIEGYSKFKNSYFKNNNGNIYGIMENEFLEMHSKIKRLIRTRIVPGLKQETDLEQVISIMNELYNIDTENEILKDVITDYWRQKFISDFIKREDNNKMGGRQEDVFGPEEQPPLDGKID